MCISLAMSKETLANKLVMLFDRCSSVVVYRCSPAEKATVLRNVASHDKTAYTLAIGDGANDVNMLQSAKIGIGIIGKEGN